MNNIKLGYARVSTSQQSLDIQIKKLIEAGVDQNQIITDKKSGKNTERAGLQKLIARLEVFHDSKIMVDLYISKMDRLGRNTLDMLDLIKGFDALGVKVHFIDDGISTGSAHSEMILTILSAVATAERLRILERTNEGRIEAKSKGIKFGAKQSINRSKVVELHSKGVGVTQICKDLDIKSRSSVYRILREQSI